MSKFPVAICVVLTAVTLFPACGGSSSSGATPPPPPVVFPNVDVIVGSRNGGITIVKDLANHGIIGADVFIDNTGPTPIDNHGNLAYENDWLAASSRDDDNILIWSGVAALTNNQAPNAILNATNVRKITIVGADLYAVLGTDEVWIWRDITTVTTGDPADAVLTGFNRPTAPLVHNDVLYVADRNDDLIWVYNGASTLVGGEAPTLTLPAQGCRHLRLDDGTLWATSDDEPGRVLGWSDLTTLAAGQQPDRFIFGLFKASRRAGFAINGNRAYIGNDADRDGFMLFRFDLSTSETTPAGSVKDVDSGLDRIYALDNSVDGIVVGSDNDVNAIFYYPPLLGNGQAPTGWVFDTRLQDAKDIIVIQR